MCLSIVSEELVEEEKQIQVTINQSIDDFRHIIFNAGAGAGKTYALTESLKYIISEHLKKLTYHNQNVLCITYTKVATNEIKKRLGNTSLVKVSTIHEQLWLLIQDYQKQLVQIHKENLESKIEELLFEVYEDSDNSNFTEFRNLTQNEKNRFIELMEAKKDIFYRVISKAVAEVRSSFADIIEEFPDILKAKVRFDKTVRRLYKIKNYSDCLEQIQNNVNGFQKVKYESKYNNDILHKMLISHDTLLDYSLKLVSSYDIFKQIIIQKYPYILIDEYQDTNEKVVNIIHKLADYSNENNYKLFIGYFGDNMQNIYNGVGTRINEIHSNLESINKRFNRRSSEKIINTINRIRNDDIRQVSIYEDSNCGEVDFYQGSMETLDNFISESKLNWNINEDNKLHCLVLKNELVAKYNGFPNIYDTFKDTKYYKQNWDNINSELLGNDLSKLGNIQVLFYNILRFKHDLENPKTSILSIIKEDIYKPLKFNFKELDDLVNLLKSFHGNTLKEYIESIFEIYNQNNIKGLNEVIENLFKKLNGGYSYEYFESYLLDNLFKDIDDDEFENAITKIEALLSINLEEYKVWIDFINKEENSEIIYHTYHGTKGEEYDNVIIVMQNNFRGNDNKFSSFFSGCEPINENTKNLLYVACSRAIKNLRVFYLDDVTDFKNGIENIFGEVLNIN
ncbi:MAG: UvrD-helicase domain-containing protein [Halarcobacter ebronensis]|uniref:UvrD-helicase domain-containing protein n=1 Tax=Halarcobacter ebronensis TaxID=1462615 RepID=UPI003C71E0E5